MVCRALASRETAKLQRETSPISRFLDLLCPGSRAF
jgi:hypothetical protein